MAVRAETSESTNLTPGNVSALAIEARDRIADFVEISPVVVGSDPNVFIKNETVQPGRSFKDRGAGNAVIHHTENGEELVVTASAGNHGRGLARAAQENGAEAIVVVGQNAIDAKKKNIARYGATVVEHGLSFDEALPHSLALAEDRGGKFVHPFADELVIAGQATIALELLDQEPDMTHVVLPVGGGGLLAGVASVIKEHKQDVKVVAAQVHGNRGYVDSLKQGRPLQEQPTNPAMEGIAVGNIHPMTFELAKRSVDQTVIVDSIDLQRAIFDFNKDHNTLLEIAGSVGIAAATKIAKQTNDQASRVVTVATGANPAPAMRGWIAARARRFGWDVDN